MDGALAKYSAEGVENYEVTATKGERCRSGSKEPLTLEAVGHLRDAELRAAASVLGVCEVSLLGYCDGELDRANPTEAIGKIVAQLRRVRPDVVVTFAPDGAYGHPDHIAICQFTTAAIVQAAQPAALPASDLAPHGVAKLYYMVATQQLLDAYQSVFGELVMHIDGKERRGVGWPEWAITTRIDTQTYRQTVWEAVLCHESQLSVYRQLEQVSQEYQEELWDSQSYYRALSLVNGGRRVEEDLFEGLR